MAEMADWQIIGQKNVAAFLAKSLEKGVLCHAYLLTAPEHSGKTALALKLAQALNCTGDNSPCGGCESCRRITAGIHADVRLISVQAADEDGKNRVELSIEQVREINHAVSLPPFEGKFRVIIIDEAERLSTGAANALLKTLEEPPPGVVFILTTVRENQLPETIRSRCMKLRLAAAPRREIVRFLEHGLGFPAERADLLARLSQGRAGWAIAAARDEGLQLERRDNLLKLTDALDSGFDFRFELADKLSQRFGKTRTEIYRLLDQWLSFCRDILLVKLDIKEEVINTDYEIITAELASRITAAEAQRLIGSLNATRRHLEQNASPRLALEVLMLNLPVIKGSTNRIG